MDLASFDGMAQLSGCMIVLLVQVVRRSSLLFELFKFLTGFIVNECSAPPRTSRLRLRLGRDHPPSEPLFELRTRRDSWNDSDNRMQEPNTRNLERGGTHQH